MVTATAGPGILSGIRGRGDEREAMRIMLCAVGLAAGVLFAGGASAGERAASGAAPGEERADPRALRDYGPYPEPCFGDSTETDADLNEGNTLSVEEILAVINPPAS